MLLPNVIYAHAHAHTNTRSNLGCFAQGYIDMWTGGDGDRTSDPATGEQPPLTPEAKKLISKQVEKSQISTKQCRWLEGGSVRN